MNCVVLEHAKVTVWLTRQDLKSESLKKSLPNSAKTVSVFAIFLVRVSCIRNEYGDLQGKFLYPVQIKENKAQENSENDHFLRSVIIH